jgi:hypothetical protein
LRELHKEFEVTLYLNGLSTIVEKERMEQWVVSERLTMTRALNSHLFEPFIFTFSWSSKYLNNVDSIMCFITSVTYVFFNLRNGRTFWFNLKWCVLIEDLFFRSNEESLQIDIHRVNYHKEFLGNNVKWYQFTTEAVIFRIERIFLEN